MLNKFKKAVIKRKYWLRQTFVASIASASAWFIGNRVYDNGGLVAAIVCALSIRVSLLKSVREGFGQVIGTAIGAGIALITVNTIHSSFAVIAITVFMCAVLARAIRLGEVASVNVPVTALIVIGPGLSESTAFHRFTSTVIGALTGIAFSYFSHPKTPAGRTTDQLKRVGKLAAKLVGDMSEGVSIGYSQEVAGEWLTEARLLIEEIPALRSQSLEAKRYARWSPMQEADLADHLYLRAIALEHTLVQVRTIARTLFDLSVEGELNKDPNKPIAIALSYVSYALAENAEIPEDENYQSKATEIANELRSNYQQLAKNLINDARNIKQETLIKEISIVSNIERIADSIDESSPALSDVAMPDEPAHQQIIAQKSIESSSDLGKRVWRSIRNFLRR